MPTKGNMSDGDLFATIATWVVAIFVLIIVGMVMVWFLGEIAGALF